MSSRSRRRRGAGASLLRNAESELAAAAAASTLPSSPPKCLPQMALPPPGRQGSWLWFVRSTTEINVICFRRARVRAPPSLFAGETCFPSHVHPSVHNRDITNPRTNERTERASERDPLDRHFVVQSSTSSIPQGRSSSFAALTRPAREGGWAGQGRAARSRTLSLSLFLRHASVT